MSFDPDVWLAATATAPEPAAFDPDECLKQTEPSPGLLTRTGHAFAQGALDQGVGSAAEGALRSADALHRSAQTGAALGDEYRQLGAALGEMQRAEMQGPNESRREQIAKIRQRMTDLTAQAAPQIEAIKAAPGLKPAAAKVGEFRQAVRDVYPLSEQDQASTGLGVAKGVGQAVAMIPAMLAGLGLPASAGQLFDQGYQDAKDSKADDDTAVAAGVANLPSALLEFAAEKVQLAPLLKGFRAGKVSKEALSKALVKRGLQAFGAESTTEAAQQLLQNANARASYDLDRDLSEGVGQSALIGGLTGATVSTGSTLAERGIDRLLDTGRNLPESPQTLKAQQDQLLAGRRAAQMFPVDRAGKVMGELPLPEGMKRVETPRGVFHYNPQLVTADEIFSASAKGQENRLLALGPISKPEVEQRAAAGEPRIAVTERTPTGQEVKTSVATTGTAPVTAAALQATKTPGNAVAVEPLASAVASRAERGEFVARMMAQEKARAEEQRLAKARESLEREQRQKELAARQARFDETLSAARALAQQPGADFPAINGALESVRFYAEDNTLGLTEEQRQTARTATAYLERRAAAMRPAWEQARAAANAEAAAAAQAQQSAQREAQTAAKADFRAEVAAGRAADGSLDYSRMTTDKLAELAQTGDTRAERTLMEKESAPADERETLIDALKTIRLPLRDEALGGELQHLLFEEMTGGQRKQLTSTRAKPLDAVAEQLRERGFASIQTPADVIDAVQRAVRGEDMRADHANPGDVAFAAAAKRSDIATTVLPQALDKTVEVVVSPGETLEQSVGRKFLNEDTGREIAVPRTAAKKQRNQPSEAAGANTPELLRTMRLVGSEPDNAGRHNITAIHRFVGAIRRGGEMVPVRATVREMRGGEMILRHLETVDEGARPIGTSDAGPNNRQPSPLNTERAIKVRDLLPGVKQEADGSYVANFANAAEERPAGLTDAEAEREIALIRRTFPELTRDYDLELGLVEDMLRARGYAGAVPATAQAAVLRLHAQRALIVLSARAYRDRTKGAGLLTHEVAHTYWATLPEETKAQLRELHAREVAEKSGPLYHDGVLQSELAYVEDLDENGHQEWFAERVARLNEAWAKGEIDRAEHSLLIRLAYQVREFVRHVWSTMAVRDGIDPDSELFVREFRRFFVAGADQDIGRTAGAAYAERTATSLATTREEAASPASPPTQTAPLKVPARTWRAAIQQGSPQIPGYVQLDMVDAEGENHGSTSPEKVRAMGYWLPDFSKFKTGSYEMSELLDMDPPPVSFATGKPDPDEVIRHAQRVEPRPKIDRIDRKSALIAELKRARALRDEGIKQGNFDAEREGNRIVHDMTQRLDEEFPGWDSPPRETAPAGPPAPPNEPPDAATAAGPEDNEPSPFNPAEGEAPLPVRPGKFNEVYGQDAYHPTALARSWRRVRDVIVGIKGAIPELPTFPAAKLNQTDRFIREHGPQFYNRVKEGLRALRSGNDYVQRTAEEQVARITRPLIEAGGKFDSEDYAKLRRAQETARRMRAEQQVVPGSLHARIAALNSKMETSPYVLFERLVLALDLNWRQQNLKDSQDNPIALPGNVNAAEVQAELQRLGQRIAASPHAEVIEHAVREHMALVKQVADDLKSRELIAGEELANPYYFPHVTLEVTRGGKTEQRELRVERVRPGTEADFRGYLIDPVGSAKPISTDYVKSMYYHLVQVGAHNLHADAVRDFFRPYDVRAKVTERARQLSRERGVPVSWEQAFHEEFAPEGYVLYGADSRDAFPSIEIDRDKLARRLGVALTSDDLQAQLQALGLRGVTLLPEDLNETLQRSAKETWILPARVAEALRGVAEREGRQDDALATGLKWALGKWKAWKLFMPWNHLRYEYGNVVADTEKLLSADPRTFKYLPSSARELRDFWRGGEPSPDLRAAMKEGVINAITAQEMGGLTRLKAFEAFQTKAERAWDIFKRRGSSILYQPVTSALGLGDFSSPELSALREAITRYAKFKADLEAIRAGAQPHYAGAYWRDIEAMTDSAPGANDVAIRKAAAISKATFGDYGDLSVLGSTLRDKVIPFYSWMEINFRYHANLLRNLRDMVRAGEASQAEAAKAGVRSAAVFAAGFTARAAGGIVLRLALPYLAVAMWNNSGDRDELEKLLSDEDRRRFHIILGRAADGKVDVIYGNTAFMDVAKWISGPKFVQAISGWMNGRTDFPTAFSSWRDEIVPDFLNNVANSVGPYFKIPYTLFSKKNPFPNVLDQRTVPAYDMRRVILGQITDDFIADGIERAINKDYYGSKDLGDWAKQLILQARQRDPEAWAFYEMKDKAADFVQKATGVSRDPNFNAPDQQVLRNFRRAIYRGDVKKATQFYLRLLDYGYTSERFAASIRAQDPLSGLPKALRQPFIASLTPFDREQLQRANEYYKRINAGRGLERQLFPSKRWGEAWMNEYRQHPKTDVLQRMMGR
jgi:hypothetical protein